MLFAISIILQLSLLMIIVVLMGFVVFAVIYKVITFFAPHLKF